MASRSSTSVGPRALPVGSTPVIGVTYPATGKCCAAPASRAALPAANCTASSATASFPTNGIASAAGDSGGPVWMTRRDGSAVLVGVWLGQHIDGDGNRYGRFITLAAALRSLMGR